MSLERFVTDEMVEAFEDAQYGEVSIHDYFKDGTRLAIAAALEAGGFHAEEMNTYMGRGRNMREECISSPWQQVGEKQ